MQLTKITFTSGLFILVLTLSSAAQSDSTKSLKGIISVQPDSFKAQSWHPHPDTIHIPGNCTPEMPTMKFSGPKPAEMPKMSVDEELTSNMPIVGQDSRCVEKELPEK